MSEKYSDCILDVERSLIIISNDGKPLRLQPERCPLDPWVMTERVTPQVFEQHTFNVNVVENNSLAYYYIDRKRRINKLGSNN